MWKELSYFLSLVLLMVLCGCGGGQPADLPPLVPASGTMTLDGKALTETEISFHTLGETKGPGSVAFSDAEGKFTLVTSRQPGAAVGEYSVTVIKYGKPDGSPLTAEEKEDPRAFLSNILPKQYEDMEQTPLKVTIGEEGNESITLQLESTGGTSSERNLPGNAEFEDAPPP